MTQVSFNMPPMDDCFTERYGPQHTRNPRISYFAVHPSDIGFILGKNGITLKVIEDETGAGITLVPYTKMYPTTPPHFEIQGKHDVIMKAINRLHGLCAQSLQRQWEKSAKTSEVTNTLTIARDDMKMVIGKGGRTIMGINQRYNVRSFTRIDEADPKNLSVIDITGYGPDVAAARKHIHNIVYESQKRRGLVKSPEQQNEEMFTILKEQEDLEMIARMKRLYQTDTEAAKKEYRDLFAMLYKSDTVLLDKVKAEISRVREDKTMVIRDGDREWIVPRALFPDNYNDVEEGELC